MLVSRCTYRGEVISCRRKRPVLFFGEGVSKFIFLNITFVIFSYVSYSSIAIENYDYLARNQGEGLECGRGAGMIALNDSKL